MKSESTICRAVCWPGPGESNYCKNNEISSSCEVCEDIVSSWQTAHRSKRLLTCEFVELERKCNCKEEELIAYGDEERYSKIVIVKGVHLHTE